MPKYDKVHSNHIQQQNTKLQNNDKTNNTSNVQTILVWFILRHVNTINGYQDEVLQRTVFPGGHPSKY
jgi:hypothetical protein